jgi:hypothetical protein
MPQEGLGCAWVGQGHFCCSQVCFGLLMGPLRLLRRSGLTLGARGELCQRCCVSCVSSGAIPATLRSIESAVWCPCSTNCSQLTSVLGCFRGRHKGSGHMCWRMLSSTPRRCPRPAQTCLMLYRLLGDLCEQVWCSLGAVVKVLSDGPIWASGAMYFNRISIKYLAKALHELPTGQELTSIKCAHTIYSKY